jgi:hypothetical protein
VSDETILNNVLNPQGPMQHAKIKMPSAKGTYPANHPLVNADMHDRLLLYLQQRLYAGKYARDSRLDRLCQIDKQVAGWMSLSKEDRDRQAKNQETGRPVPTEINLPLVFVHLDDMMTYFAQTFAPSQGMFYQTGKPQEQQPAKQIVTLMNNHAIYAGYYREVLLGLYSILKYNIGGYKVNWSKDSGPKLTKNGNGDDILQTTTVWQGNRLEAIDMYNFLPDPSIHPTKLHCDGEFAAQAFVRSKYWLQRKAALGLYYNLESLLREDQGVNQWVYYVSPPKQANLEADESGGTNWKAVLSENTTTNAGPNYELVEITINLNPTEWGLVTAKDRATRDRYETWKFTICNNNKIISTQYLNNIHGFLPFFFGLLNDDVMSTSSKSVAEILTPLQTFASSLINTHIKSNRKNLWGTTFYDPSMFDMEQVKEGDVAGRVKMKAQSWGRDIRTGIFKETTPLDTKQTMVDLESVMGIVDKFFPTQSLPSQIASIDRAIDSQVAAVQQGANKRQQKAARLLDETVFRFVRFAMYYNIIQYQPDAEEVTDYYSGNTVKISLDQLRQTDLPFIIGQGLKAIDRQAAAKAMQSIIFALIQAPQAQQGINLLAMIDFWSSMIDIDIDMTQFEIQQQPQQPGQEQPQVDATGNPIVPATNPNALTAPIRKANVQ